MMFLVLSFDNRKDESMSNYEETARSIHRSGNSCSASVYNAFKDVNTSGDGKVPAPRSEGGKCGAVLAAEKLINEMGLGDEKVSFEREFRRLFIYIGVMMNTDGGTQIADFYMASGNIYNIITHGMSRELNRTFGILFMQSLYLAGNKYATRLLVT